MISLNYSLKINIGLHHTGLFPGNFGSHKSHWNRVTYTCVSRLGPELLSYKLNECRWNFNGNPNIFIKENAKCRSFYAGLSGTLWDVAWHCLISFAVSKILVLFPNSWAFSKSVYKCDSRTHILLWLGRYEVWLQLRTPWWRASQSTILLNWDVKRILRVHRSKGTTAKVALILFLRCSAWVLWPGNKGGQLW